MEFGCEYYTYEYSSSKENPTSHTGIDTCINLKVLKFMLATPATAAAAAFLSESQYVFFARSFLPFRTLRVTRTRMSVMNNYIGIRFSIYSLPSGSNSLIPSPIMRSTIHRHNKHTVRVYIILYAIFYWVVSCVRPKMKKLSSANCCACRERNQKCLFAVKSTRRDATSTVCRR